MPFNQFDIRSTVMAGVGGIPLGIVDPPVRTYDAYYGDSATDSFGGDYTTIMSMYECGNGAAAGTALATDVRNCSATAIPTAFLLLGIRPEDT